MLAEISADKTTLDLGERLSIVQVFFFCHSMLPQYY